MNLPKALAALAILLPLVIPPTSAAETHPFAVDAVHSSVEFQIRHLLARTTGRFDVFSGTIWVDPDDVAGTLRIEGTVDAASIDTRNEKRDEHLRSADFFDVEKHGEMKFVSKSVEAHGDEYHVTGDLTIRGVTREVTMMAEIAGFMTSPFTGTPSTGVVLTGEIDRKDFGIEWNKALDAGGFVLGDDVKITVHLEANVPPQG
jgi:polyisoprenoid-binding protein YceI